MSLRASLRRLAAEKGLYFPINHRIIDERLDPDVAYQTDVQSRFRRELRTPFMTGETRQVQPPPWSARRRPTHFLSLPLPARCSVRSVVQDIRRTALFSHPAVEPLLIPEPKLHVTLSVFAVREGAPRPLADVHDTVEQCVADIVRGSPKPRTGLQLRFSGIGTFDHGRVLFARCAADQQFRLLDRLVREVRRRLGVGLGLDVKGNPHDSFVPHITLGKIRPRQQRIMGPAFPPSLWAEHQFVEFGDCSFAQVTCCEMRTDEATGSYPVSFSVPLC
eukprot:gene13345-9177_t